MNHALIQGHFCKGTMGKWPFLWSFSYSSFKELPGKKVWEPQHVGCSMSSKGPIIFSGRKLRLLRLCNMHRLIWIFAARTCKLVPYAGYRLIWLYHPQTLFVVGILFSHCPSVCVCACVRPCVHPSIKFFSDTT